MEFVLAEEDETKLSTKIIANAESEFLIKERERTLEIKTKITALRKLIKTKKTTKQIETLSKKLLQPEHITIEFQNKTKQVEEENSLTHGLYLDNTTNRYKDDGDLKSFNCRIKNITKPETISIEGLQVPEEIYNHLFGYQKTCLKWLWELNKQKTGGVLGDEMGLGKTVQMVTFLGSLELTKPLKDPVLIVCPATLLKQWVQEFHKWFPLFRVCILHSTGSMFSGDLGYISESDESEVDSENSNALKPKAKKQKSKQKRKTNCISGTEDESVFNSDDSNEFKPKAKKQKSKINRKKKCISETEDESEFNSENSNEFNPKLKKDKTKRKRKPSSETDQEYTHNNQYAIRQNSLPKPQQIQNLLEEIQRTGHVIITTYGTLQSYQKVFLPIKYSYCILDEGHKIRNPNAKITLVCKHLKSKNRIILSGTPIQNNLQELWSLYDFVYPGKLGTLPVFKAQFEDPIKIGGFQNATGVQVQTAYQCALTLKDFVEPYLLRRLKQDVAKELPLKTEKVLFCKLSVLQRRVYEMYLESDDVKRILGGNQHSFSGIDVLRKICNHPDLVLHNLIDSVDQLSKRKRKAVDRVKGKGRDYSGMGGNGSREKSMFVGGSQLKEVNKIQTETIDEDPEINELVQKSGKMMVLNDLLKIWKAEGHKVLIFCQTRQMLDIIETFLRAKYDYLRMDGNTDINKRLELVDRYNSTDSIFIFLSSTKVGGLGVNLTGANRCIIYDPDWNPSTDMQARERLWRIGQKREVFVYRFLMAGTIEEKIYQRQIFKQNLGDKILKDPKQKRIFKDGDLKGLFTLGLGENETEKIFKEYDGVNVDIQVDNVVNSADFEDEEVGVKEQDRIISALFQNGVSALYHEAIVNSKKPDHKLMVQEAGLIAKDAAKELKKSAKKARGLEIGTPTWTGKFGSGGKPGTSSSLLSNLKQKSRVNVVGQDSSKSRGQDLAERLRKFLLGKYKVATELIKSEFHDFSSPKDLRLMQELLREIAEFKREGLLAGWTLKEEYR